jgi:hypothetical protein
MTGFTLDAGALIALDRNDRRTIMLLDRAIEREEPITVPAGVVGQVWRDGRKQARLSRFLSAEGVSIEPLDDPRARASGQLCGLRGTADVIDASVVLGARRRGDKVVTSDPEDLRRLDNRIDLIIV